MKTEQTQQFREVKEYNGWSNYPTWCVKLWLDNDEGTYNFWQDATKQHKQDAPTCQQVKEGIWTVEQTVRFNLADQLKNEITNNRPEQTAEQCGMYFDLMCWAFDYVNWNEIAKALIEEITE